MQYKRPHVLHCSYQLHTSGLKANVGAGLSLKNSDFLIVISIAIIFFATGFRDIFSFTELRYYLPFKNIYFIFSSVMFLLPRFISRSFFHLKCKIPAFKNYLKLRI